MTQRPSRGANEACGRFGRGTAVASAAAMLVAVAASACGGEPKHAQSPASCSDGTVLQGDDCVPQTAVEPKASGGDEPAAAATSHDAPASGASEGPAYDKEAVDSQLKRAARQVKANCGSASDEDGNKTGPWGSTTATIVLGRNGHVASVSVPAPYDGKPVGDCVVNSFRRIEFPPYPGASDATVTWDVEIARPKH